MKIEPIIDDNYDKIESIPFKDIPIDRLYQTWDGCYCIKLDDTDAVQIMNEDGIFDTEYGSDVSGMGCWDAMHIFHDLKGFKFST